MPEGSVLSAEALWRESHWSLTEAPPAPPFASSCGAEAPGHGSAVVPVADGNRSSPGNSKLPTDCKSLSSYWWVERRLLWCMATSPPAAAASISISCSFLLRRSGCEAGAGAATGANEFPLDAAPFRNFLQVGAESLTHPGASDDAPLTGPSPESKSRNEQLPDCSLARQPYGKDQVPSRSRWQLISYFGSNNSRYIRHPSLSTVCSDWRPRSHLHISQLCKVCRWAVENNRLRISE